VELDIAALYEDLSAKLPSASPESTFFAKMAAQEHIHAAWVDEMMAGIDQDFPFPDLAEADFNVILATIEDVHDEVVHNDIGLADALEIIVHLESSTAEQFYRKFPASVPGLPAGMVERMVNSCLVHAQAVAAFRDTHADILP
jgi:rubrerythrin